MKKILLMGNPNVGKSVVFSRLTGADVIASNYPGTTVDFTKGNMTVGEEEFEVIDVPGSYSLEPTTKAEEVATEMVDEGGLVINVLDSTNLERNLYLTLELLERDVPVIVVLNMWDEAEHKGIEIDSEKLEEFLGVPVVPLVALSGEGIKELVSEIDQAEDPEREPKKEEEKWAEIGKITKAVEKVKHKHHTIWERISGLTINPATGIPIAILVILASFFLVRTIGENLVAHVFEPLFELYEPLAMDLSDAIGSGLLHDILIGELSSEGDIMWEESMGLLTTGIFMPIAMILPYIIAFYFLLSLLEDSGYLPRLSTLVDNIFHKLGMHGYGIVPVFLGLGCNVPGALSIRSFETRKQRFISATLLGIAVPCMAQTAMILGILGGHMEYIILILSTLVILYIVFGMLLNRAVEGESPEIFMEIPPQRRPSGIAVFKKVWMRIRWFLGEALPWLLTGVIVINLLYSLGVLEALNDLAGPFMSFWFGLPGGASLALLVGFLRKDLAVGMLLPLGMSLGQLTVAVTVLVIYFPCMATFSVLVKELGWEDMAKSASVMLGTALIVGGIMRVLLLGV